MSVGIRPDAVLNEQERSLERVADIFEEVEEQLRSDRYIAIAKKSWPYAAGAAAVALTLALGLWGWDQYQSSIQAKASESYNQALEALSSGDRLQADKIFAEIGKSGPRGYRTLALMHEGALRIDEKKPSEAITLFDDAAKVAPDQILADAARVKAAFAGMDSGMAITEIEGRLTPLVAPDRPYHAIAREALAMARLAAGKTAAARADFTALNLMLDASDTTRARATAAIGLIDTGAAASLPAVIKAARTMPEPAIPTGPQIADPTAAPAGAE